MLRQVSFFSGAPKGSRSPRDGLGAASCASPTRSGGLFFRRPTQMRRVGGSDDTPVKKENGARFAEPSSLSVDVQAIGRGAIVATCQK